jgi:hypothetical protein
MDCFPEIFDYKEHESKEQGQPSETQEQASETQEQASETQEQANKRLCDDRSCLSNPCGSSRCWSLDRVKWDTLTAWVREAAKKRY